MAHSLKVISKRSTFVLVRSKGKFIKGESFNLQFLENSILENRIYVGYTATKRLGNAVKRNKAKRIMRELAKKVRVGSVLGPQISKVEWLLRLLIFCQLNYLI